jgi:hypothetical protein
MLSLFRPSFEVVKEGRIFHFASGYRRLFVSSKRLFMILNLLWPLQLTLKENKPLGNSFKILEYNQLWMIWFDQGFITGYGALYEALCISS